MGNAVYTWQVPWGIYVWLDVYYGFILMATLIYAYERHLGLTLLIFFIMCWTGNMIAAAWLLWRAPDIYDRIAHPRTPA
ncbi:hypothetical protein [Xanthobacter oligotrophicus]|uniref:hypothetical protein n=1 Tax=Xanthobacter oligotrophicus TaxID=2607286 RepID=UPI0011F3BABC|nr:hypothetical protein [Xanthobacter oligotrophicus]MCG5236616.1 hypothetical protein [Xanthobacter oligotrophicus]